MRPVEFAGANRVFGANQPQYRPLPAHRADGDEGRVTTCWELSDEEVTAVVRSRRIWLQVLTFWSPIQPQVVFTHDPRPRLTLEGAAEGA